MNFNHREPHFQKLHFVVLIHMCSPEKLKHTLFEPCSQVETEKEECAGREYNSRCLCILLGPLEYK